MKSLRKWANENKFLAIIIFSFFGGIAMTAILYFVDRLLGNPWNVVLVCSWFFLLLLSSGWVCISNDPYL